MPDQEFKNGYAREKIAFIEGKLCGIETGAGRIEAKLDKIISNDLAHLKISATQNTTDIQWLKKHFWKINGAITTGIIVILEVIFKIFVK